jgi:hypothetical protein
LKERRLRNIPHLEIRREGEAGLLLKETAEEDLLRIGDSLRMMRTQSHVSTLPSSAEGLERVTSGRSSQDTAQSKVSS